MKLTGDMSDNVLGKMISSVRRNSFVVLEDVDSFFEGRKSKGKYTFSGFINCLDGIIYKYGTVFFLTTNHPEKLDPAMTRKGRIDKHVKFENGTQEQIQRYYNKYLFLFIQ